MKKIVKIGFPILCVAVVGGSLIALNDISHKAKFIKEQREKENTSNTSSYNPNDDDFYFDEEFLNSNNTNISGNSINSIVNNAVENNSNTNIANDNNNVVYSVPVE